MANLSKLPTFDGRSKLVNVVIETSKASRVKLKYDEELGIFRSEKTLPLGMVFPFDFGFLPSTLGGDGDPLDALVLSETGLPWGTVVLGSVLGVLKGEQTENGEKERNDRLIAVAVDAKTREPMRPSVAFDAELKKSITDFFVKYNELQGKKFRVLAADGATRAMTVIHQGMAAARRKSEQNGDE